MAARSILDASSGAKRIAADERIMLLSLAFGADWRRAGITHATAQQMFIRGLIDRDPDTTQFKLTPLGRDVLAALFKRPADERSG